MGTSDLHEKDVAPGIEVVPEEPDEIAVEDGILVEAWPVSRQRRLVAGMAGAVLVLGGLVTLGAAVLDDGTSTTTPVDRSGDCRAYGDAAAVRPC